MAVAKIKFKLFYGKVTVTPCYGYMELDRDRHMIALYNWYGEEIELHGGHEIVRIRTLGQFDNDDRDHFYSLLESDGVG
ncbi:hypothetical protein [Paenibacillus chungangensis]|uniref:Uncharacterized protein n=1 Tax=Paenibacillus chungangensis TaxID=696535 RepID=A0ABW3HT44_9BACL